MNYLVILLITVTVQVSLLGLAVALLHLVTFQKSPRTSAKILTFGISLIAALVFVALAPIPSWMDLITPDENITASQSELESVSSGSSEFESSSGRSENEPIGNSSDDIAPQSFGFVVGVNNFLDQVQRQAERESVPARLEWTFWTLGLGTLVCLMLTSLGLIRLALGYVSLVRLKANSIVIDEPSINEAVDLIKAKFGCSKRIQIRKSPLISTAATIGWRSNLLLLSDEHENWESGHLQSVLAHEVAHVHHNDFAKNLLSQVCTAVHFFNPLVHWLAGRLRLSQEVAADQLAATLSKDRATYTKTLAAMALRQDNKRIAFAPMFLPCEKTFVRRIKMLNKAENRRLGLPAWSFSIATLLAATAICGLRIPGEETTGYSMPSLIANPSQADEASLEFISSKTDVVMIYRPATLLKSRKVRKLVKEFPWVSDIIKQQDKIMKSLAGVELKEIDQLVYGQTNPDNDNAHQYIVIKTLKDNRRNFEAAADSHAEQGGGTLLTKSPTASYANVPWVTDGFIADDKTVIWASDGESLQFAMEAGKDDAKKADWYPSWSKICESSVIMLGNRELTKEASEGFSTGGPVQLVSESQLNDLENAQSFVFGMDYNDQVSIKCYMNFVSKDQAESALESANEIATLGKSIVKPMLRNLEGPEKLIAETGLDALNKLKIEVDKSTLVATTAFQPDLKSIGAFTDSIQAAANRTRSANNIRQMALAFHNYHDVHGHFPPAVLTHESGKKYSWRIAVLPYLELGDIYDEYRFDEEWNSKHNLEVTKHAPVLFRHPDNKDGNTTNYFAVIGTETVFGAEEGTNLEDIADGTHATIMFVEAKRDFHWSKPEDISFDEAIGGDTLGGLTEGGFNVTYCDGSVHFLESSIDRKTLKALLTMKSGDTVDQ